MSERTHAVARRHFDVWNEVPLVPQLTGMSCWAAAAAMIVGWRDRVLVRPDEVANGSGRWGAYEDGLLPTDVETLARTWRLSLEPARTWDVETLRRRLEEVGPLWLGEASPGLHSIVVAGIFGDGTPDGTFVRINDPWPIGRGERYLLSFVALMQNLTAASALVGGQGQILHAGGRRRGASRSQYDEQMATTSVTSSGSALASASHHHESSVSYGGVPAGQRTLSSTVFAHDPLAAHGGTGENLFLAWTPLASPADPIDVVVHLHGYSGSAPTRALLDTKVRTSGLDLRGRTRPTLGIIPRGRKITAAELTAARAAGHPANPDRYTFPGLTTTTGQGLETLVAESLQWLARNVLGLSSGTLAIARLILTAHSGGGAPLNELLRNAPTRRVCDPHEVHVFDALYTQVDGVTAWGQSRLRRHRAGPLREEGALRIIYGAGTRAGSVAAIAALAGPGLLAGAAPAIARCYRAESTSVAHDEIPRRFGPVLLGEAGRSIGTEPSRRSAPRAMGLLGDQAAHAVD